MKQVKCEVYTRVVGYFRPTRNFNAGADQQRRERKNFDDYIPEPTKGLFVYGMPMCSGCHSLKTALSEQGIPFEYRDARAHRGLLRELVGSFDIELPLVTIDDRMVSVSEIPGYREQWVEL